MCGPRITNLWYDMCGFHTKALSLVLLRWVLKSERGLKPFLEPPIKPTISIQGPHVTPCEKKGSNMERLKTMPMHPGESEGGYIYIYIYKFASLEGSERAPFWTCSFWGSEAGLKPSRSPIWAFNPDWRERGPLGWTLPNIWVCGKKMETMYPRWQYGNKRSRPLQATKFIPPIWMIRC